MQEYRNEHGNLHRLDGPAVIHPTGEQQWWANGKIHRTDGPAVMHADGTQGWCIHGKLHRSDGPAIIRADGEHEWWFNGKQVDQLTHMLLVNQQTIQTQPQKVVL